LLECGILKESGKEDVWNVETETDIKHYLDYISPVVLTKVENKLGKSLDIETKTETTIQIPETVYALDEKEWKKYISPTVLNSNIKSEKKQPIHHIVNDYNYEEDKNKDRTKLGIFVHRVLEDLGEISLSSISHDRILEKLVDEPYLEDYLPEVKRIIKNLIRVKSPMINMIEKAVQTYSEMPLRKKFKNYILTGTVDKIFHFDDEWRIVDFKYATGSKADDEKYSFQIRFYLYCLQSLLTPIPKKGYIYYIKSDKIVEVNQITDIEQQIAKKIETFEETKESMGN